MIEDKKSAYCFFELANGNITLVSIPLTEAELVAYQKHRDIFFGKYDTRPKRPINDHLELYDRFLNNFSGASKERVLLHMKDAEDIANLKRLPRSQPFT